MLSKLSQLRIRNKAAMVGGYVVDVLNIAKERKKDASSLRKINEGRFLH